MGRLFRHDFIDVERGLQLVGKKTALISSHGAFGYGVKMVGM